MADARAQFESRVLKHLDAACRLARVYCASADEAEDVVQDAALRAYRAFGDMHGDEAGPWFLAIVRNCALSSRTRAQRQHWSPLPDDDASLDVLRDPQPEPESVALARDAGRQLAAALERLSPDHREVLLLRDVEDLSYRDIATITGVPAGTVMSRLSRARDALRAVWRPNCEEGRP